MCRQAIRSGSAERQHGSPQLGLTRHDTCLITCVVHWDCWEAQDGSRVEEMLDFTTEAVGSSRVEGDHCGGVVTASRCQSGLHDTGLGAECGAQRSYKESRI